MNFGYPAIFATTCLLLVGCSSYATSLSVQSAMPESIETQPTEEAESNPLAVALSFVTPTPEPTDTVLQVLQNWEEPDPAPTKKNSAPAVPLHVPMLPTISPDLLGNVAIRPNNILHGDRSKARIALTFDDGPASPNQSSGGYSRVFDKAGTYPYHCVNHPGMTGTVTVK